MKKDKLSKRLEKVSHFIKEGAIVADIGSDHAYLPVYLADTGKSPFVIAGDVNEGPLSSAQDQITKHNLKDKIKAKLGSGLSVLEGESVDTVVIAGMGGPLIASILDNDKEQLEGVNRLVLQPNVASDHVRKWLFDNGWNLVDEAILEEDDHVYEIAVAEKGNARQNYSSMLEKELWMGPFLLKNKNSAFEKKWKRELAQLEKIDKQLATAADRPGLKDKKQEIRLKIKWLKEELA
ncbi:tRNA (adenine(22)-N(1))-methyltransferase TrmK [Salipaludibacillus sp. CUR1]|uniref:tRNA (adenine(22)-N(1))-methyltransferase n=1 Tax=Salipaludibacillus sp. CUR1 TaxID=2820003 RepID=UPI001E5436ED|nr:tRNA (adenine(22)-N(1))-methyltransferase TrmK [Salipaludibacillus sp. CUR1]MCE7794230.1 tRNA (adenine(22)-N(1))-methyltransferase TrmK [Salipaludibacillus sp. CUR1]